MDGDVKEISDFFFDARRLRHKREPRLGPRRPACPKDRTKSEPQGPKQARGLPGVVRLPDGDSAVWSRPPRFTIPRHGFAVLDCHFQARVGTPKLSSNFREYGLDQRDQATRRFCGAGTHRKPGRLYSRGAGRRGEIPLFPWPWLSAKNNSSTRHKKPSSPRRRPPGAPYSGRRGGRGRRRRRRRTTTTTTRRRVNHSPSKGANFRNFWARHFLTVITISFFPNSATDKKDVFLTRARQSD